jgi:hypothetical protein
MPIFLLPYLYSQIVLASLASTWTLQGDGERGDQ